MMRSRLQVAMDTAAMGFFATATGMVECLRSAPSLLSDARSAYPDHAASPGVVSSRANAADNDNASEAMAASVGQHVPLGGDSCGPVSGLDNLRDAKGHRLPQAARGASFLTMSIAITPLLVGMFSRKVANITGLSERQLENLHPIYFGSPGHYGFMGGVGGGSLYTPKGLCGLVEALRLAGHVAESATLANEIRTCGLEFCAPGAAPIMALPARSHAEPLRSRLLEWEDAHS